MNIGLKSFILSVSFLLIVIISLSFKHFSYKKSIDRGVVELSDSKKVPGDFSTFCTIHHDVGPLQYQDGKHSISFEYEKNSPIVLSDFIISSDSWGDIPFSPQGHGLQLDNLETEISFFYGQSSAAPFFSLKIIGTDELSFIGKMGFADSMKLPSLHILGGKWHPQFNLEMPKNTSYTCSVFDDSRRWIVSGFLIPTRRVFIELNISGLSTQDNYNLSLDSKVKISIDEKRVLDTKVFHKQKGTHGEESH